MNKYTKMIVVAGILFVNNVFASSIEYRFSGVATGSIDSTQFIDSSFVVTLYGDTDNVGTPFDPLISSNNGLEGLININGIGNGTFIEPLYVFNWNWDPDYPDWEAIGFGGLDINGSERDIINIEYFGTGLFDYDLRTSYGPITSATSTDLYNSTQLFGLNIGNLSFTEVNEVSFEATVVPIPASLWLFSSGVIGLLGIARHSKTR